MSKSGGKSLGFCSTSLDVENFLKGKCVLENSENSPHRVKCHKILMILPRKCVIYLSKPEWRTLRKCVIYLSTAITQSTMRQCVIQSTSVTLHLPVFSYSNTNRPLCIEHVYRAPRCHNGVMKYSQRYNTIILLVENLPPNIVVLDKSRN